MKQMVIRVYPNGWTGNSIGELNKLLNDGWQVKIVTPSTHNQKGDIISDYILEKPNDPAV